MVTRLLLPITYPYYPMNNPPQLVKDIGEKGLLKRIESFCPSGVIGDDGAVLSTHPDKNLVVSTDVLVDKVHFSDRTTTAFDVGWRAAAANLSDLAAMGAEPLGITVGLSLPGEVEISWVENFYRGINACLQPYNTPILGGDICRSTVITVAITAMGQVFPERVIRRRNAKVGDAIVMTGYHGLARAGLELLLHPEIGTQLKESERNLLIKAHQQPQPRLDILPYLWELKPARAMAGMDSSDGLADAIVQICHCSGVGAEIERDSLRNVPLLSKLVTPEQMWSWILYGGEDFELILCLDLENAQKLLDKLDNRAVIIGKIIPRPQIVLKDKLNIYSQQILSLSKGFQHF